MIPVICSFGLSFVQWDLLNPIKFVGFENYREIFHDGLFYKILGNTIVFALSTSFLGVIIPLILASILNTKIRGSEFLKVLISCRLLLPWLLLELFGHGFLTQILVY